MITVPRYLSSGLKKVKDPKNDAHLYDTLIHLNPSQMSLAREHVAQLAGRGASALYGHQKFAEPFENPALRRAAHHMVDLPQHHFARVAVAHKEIGGSLKKGWKERGKNAFRKLGTHFINNIGTYADIGTGIGQMTGLLSNDVGDAIRTGADVVGSMFGKDEDKDKDENKEEGGGLQIY